MSTGVILLMSVFEIAGIVAAVRAFRTGRRGRGVAALAAMALATCALLVFELAPSDPNTVGRRATKPAGLNTPVSVQYLTISVPRVWTDREMSATRAAIDARKLKITVQVTCELAPGETCSPTSYRWELGGLSSPITLWSSQPIREIAGGETVEVELSTDWKFYDTTSFKGAILEVYMRERAWNRLRSAYFDLLSNQP
jgi:hypothetical protein